jgi:hypothetical protein
MNKILKFMAVATVSGSALFFTGCRSTEADESEKLEPQIKNKEEAELKNINDQKKDEIRKIAESYIDDILIGMKDRNYKLFARHLTDELREQITRPKFELMVDKFVKEKGVYKSKQYLGELGKNYFKVFLWKGQFIKKGKKEKDEDIKNDTLIRIILGNVDDKYLVFGFSFQ